MGKPVRILDLAKDMIRLYGYEPDTDIKIQFSGVRPGEKIHETLTNTDEDIVHTQWEGLSTVHGIQALEIAEMDELLDRLAEYVREHDADSVLAVFQATLPHFAANRESCEA